MQRTTEHRRSHRVRQLRARQPHALRSSLVTLSVLARSCSCEYGAYSSGASACGQHRATAQPRTLRSASSLKETMESVAASDWRGILGGEDLAQVFLYRLDTQPGADPSQLQGAGVTRDNGHTAHVQRFSSVIGKVRE